MIQIKSTNKRAVSEYKIRRKYDMDRFNPSATNRGYVHLLVVLGKRPSLKQNEMDEMKTTLMKKQLSLIFGLFCVKS